jgi:signal transduction histidine kinase
VRRLYLQIWLAFLGILVVFAALLAGVWWTLPDDRDRPPFAETASRLVAEALGPPGEPPDRVRDRLARLTGAFPGRVTVLGADGAVLAHRGEPLPPPPHAGGPRLPGGMHHVPGAGPVFLLRLDDGRTILVGPPHPPRRGRFLVALGLLVLTTAVGAYFVVRRITRRVETLRTGVEALGGGDLSARVAVEGHDEIARLAASFNDAAGRIEQLVSSNRTLLANVSHELRSPLSRIRMALELLDTGARPELHARLTRDITELDALIGELLLSGRVEAQGARREDRIELLALSAEEAATWGAGVSGCETFVPGDERLLRRLLRNLLENAVRHGGGTPVEVEVGTVRDRPGLRVMDRGPGVAAPERERIFEAFYRPQGMPESGHGAGLGLALVRSIARAHGGDVACLPREGGGSLFEVWFDAGAGGAASTSR